MGMYTEILFRAEMVQNWAEDPKVKMAIETLSVVESPYIEDGQRSLLPDHPFFDCHRWQLLSRCDSYYFPFGNHNNWVHDHQGGYYWSFRANLKNYDDEIAQFFDWIDPYLREPEGEFLGYSLYEEDNSPSLYFKGGQSDG